jgi:hypothetical protein
MKNGAGMRYLVYIRDANLMESQACFSAWLFPQSYSSINLLVSVPNFSTSTVTSSPGFK